MTFRPDVLAGGGAGGAGLVDYRLARRSVLAEFRRGRLSQTEVCDAHPELVRAAREYSRPTEEICPICEDECLALVTYVFGPRLPAHGRCVGSLEELRRFTAEARRSSGTFTCYVVEVCPGCSWNYLARVFPLADADRGAR
ncbi:MAG: hypothetical protein FJW83_09610 [Actinobacteria bacterium]|nr:hypothetical protein [Actinomycetota bacterium]